MIGERALDGRCAVVTGAAGGIGRAVVRRLCEHGADVVAVDADAARLADVREELPRVLTAVADVSSEEGTASYVARAVDAHGRVDLFFNNAGVSGPVAPVWDVGVEDFDRVMAVNVRGVFLGLRDVLRSMKESGAGGSIVNTASLGGLGGGPRFSPYIASKHAVVGLTRAAAHDAAPHGIRVNAVAPGLVDTAMTQGLAVAAGGDWSMEERSSAIPGGRYATPEEIAASVVWLLSDEASYVNGAILTVDAALSA